MRLYDDPVEVRKGMVRSGTGGSGTGGSQGGDCVEGPEQFLWRGRLWKVRDVLAHWVETGPWWESSGVHAVLGSDDPPGQEMQGQARPDLLAEREVWRVEAGRGLASTGQQAGTGVFDLVFDWAQGSWQLTRCVD